MSVAPDLVGFMTRSAASSNFFYSICGGWLLFCCAGASSTKTTAVVLPSKKENWKKMVIFPMILRRLLSRWVTKAWPLLLPGYLTTLRRGGPLGQDSHKLVNILVGIGVFWSILGIRHNKDKIRLWVYFCRPGPVLSSDSRYWWFLPSLAVGLVLIAFFFLWLWSTHQQQHQQQQSMHPGVHGLVDQTIGRSLTIQEQTNLLGWAFANAVCEEVEFRGLCRTEFQSILALFAPTTTTTTTTTTQSDSSSPPSLSSSSMTKKNFRYLDPSNLLQAVLFGLVHYHGIPSGLAGVVLCFIYGYLSGLLADIGGGLLYPVVAHTIADYFILSHIVRKTT